MRRNRVLMLTVLIAATVASALVFQPAAQAASTCTQGFPYTVQRGDDLFRIANRFGTTVATLQVFNGLPNANRINAGQTICINNATYIVQSGDTLNSIASRLGVSVSELERVNNITNPSLIETGQQLLIPSTSVPSLYTVQMGDTLTKIAGRYGTTVSVLAQTNHITNVNLILVGQVLVVPVGGTTTMAAAPAPAPATGMTAPAPAPAPTMPAPSPNYGY